MKYCWSHTGKGELRLWIFLAVCSEKAGHVTLLWFLGQVRSTVQSISFLQEFCTPISSSSNGSRDWRSSCLGPGFKRTGEDCLVQAVLDWCQSEPSFQCCECQWKIWYITHPAQDFFWRDDKRQIILAGIAWPTCQARIALFPPPHSHLPRQSSVTSGLKRIYCKYCVFWKNYTVVFSEVAASIYFPDRTPPPLVQTAYFHTAKIHRLLGGGSGGKYTLAATEENPLYNSDKKCNIWFIILCKCEGVFECSFSNI